MNENTKSWVAGILSAVLGLLIGCLTHSSLWGGLVFVTSAVGMGGYLAKQQPAQVGSRRSSPPVMRCKRDITWDGAGVHSGTHPSIPWSHIEDFALDLDDGGTDGALVVLVAIKEEFEHLYDLTIWLEFGPRQDPDQVVRQLRHARLSK